MPNPIKFNLRTKPIQAIQVNKRVVIIMSAILTLTILLSVIYAFSSPSMPKPQARKSQEIKADTDKPLAIGAELKDLPSSYSDVNGINKYMNAGSSIEFENLKQQLDSLKNSYTSLEQQLNDKNKEKHRESPEDDAARKGPIAFKDLGGTAETLAGPDTPFGKGTSKDKDKGDENASKKQEEFYEKKGENKRKLDVMKAQVDDPASEIYDMHPMIKPISKYQVNAGTLIPATLITAIDSTIAGTILAQVRQDVYDTVTGRYLLIPKGSKLIGEYGQRPVAYGQHRIAMIFTRVMRPDGSSISLGKPMGADRLGQAGVEGDVDNHWAQVIGATTLSALLSVGAAVAANRNVNAANNQVTTGQQVGQGLSSSISNVGNQLTSRAMSIGATISLQPGYQFFITTKKDMIMTPYKKRR